MRLIVMKIHNTAFSLFVLLASLSISPANAMDSVFVVAEATLPAVTLANPTDPSPFTTIAFPSPFASGTVPNVFAMTPEFGAGAADDPCTIRIRNITNIGFDAACLEPINEDRNSPGLTFEYIAIQDGGVTVPLVGGGGDVEFRSQCISTTAQQYGNNCAACSGAETYQAVSFTPVFSAVPAVLTQIQTTNNLISGEPIFLDTAVRTDSLSAAGFDLANEQMEAGTGPIATAEEICYLAVLRDGCQNLDFSSLSGPSSVMFEAVFGGNDTDGHGNGCTTGEGATFTPACFSSTPIALAKQISRRGGDGGFMRRCSVSTSEIILTYDEDRVSNAERNHIDEESAALAFSTVFTTPVTLSNAQVTQFGRKTSFSWETSAETFHLGFDLWGETKDGWVQLNKKFITGTGVDTAESTRYRHSVRLTRSQYNEISRFGLSSIDNTGFEEFYGPFEVGEEYGEAANSEPLDWTQTRIGFEKSMQQRGFSRVNNRWRKLSSRAQQRLERIELGIKRSVFELSFDKPGIHSLAASSLLDLNPQWTGKNVSHVALTLNGQAVPRHIISQDKSLSADDRIIFYVKPPSGVDAIYLNDYVYQLRMDRSRAVDAASFDGTLDLDKPLFSEVGFSQLLTQKRAYSATLANGDPWYDSRLLTTGSPVSKTYNFDFLRDINSGEEGKLDIEVVGGIDLPDEVADHHVQIFVNDVLVDDKRFDGLNAYKTSVSVPAGLLKQSANRVTVNVPGDTGLFADLVLVDELRISALTPLSGHANYDFAHSASADGYRVALQAESQEAEVFAYNDNGALSHVKVLQKADNIVFSSVPYKSSVNNPSELRYAIGSAGQWAEPTQIRLTRGNNLHSKAASYLIVAHPSFRGEQLDEFVRFKTEQGYQLRIVDWLDLVETYGYGNDTPAALDNFLHRLDENFPVENVLLVGGHTYDYLGILDDNIINFIPAHYRSVDIFAYAPSDNPYADLDMDNLPDLAIGRWPVRTLNDLKTIIKKTKDWHANRDSDPYQDALLIAQQDDNRGLDFTGQIEGRVSYELAEMDGVENITKVYIQELLEAGVEDPIGNARNTIRDAINNGLELVSFNGHGSTSAWGFQGIVNTDFVKNLDNAGHPTVVMPLACYTTNYENPSVNTLAHQWLFSGDRGAVAIHGASVLGEYRENGVFANRYLRKVKITNTIGGAILKAKREMAPWNQMLNNWGLLGEPTLPLR